MLVKESQTCIFNNLYVRRMLALCPRFCYEGIYTIWPANLNPVSLLVMKKLKTQFTFIFNIQHITILWTYILYRSTTKCNNLKKLNMDSHHDSDFNSGCEAGSAGLRCGRSPSLRSDSPDIVPALKLNVCVIHRANLISKTYKGKSIV